MLFTLLEISLYLLLYHKHYTFAFSPVAKTAFAPLPFVFIVEFFIVVVEFEIVKTPAFTP